MKTFLIGAFLTVLNYVGGVELPCAARDGAPGQSKLCVCNSTYCDTIEQPTQLDKTQFHYYKTSNSTPGFTHSILDFSQELVSGHDTDEVVFTIDPTERFQEYVGLGGSLSDVVGILYNSFSPDTQDKFIKSYFGPSGIEYSLVRIPMGNTDFSTRVYTLDDVPTEDEDLSHFSLANEDYIYRIPMIKAAMSLSDRQIKLSACTWSSPKWMRVGASEFGNYIDQKYDAVWAQYHVKFLEAYKENGLDVWALSGGNEPYLLFVLPLEGGTLNVTLSTADGQARWIKNHLKPSLVAANFSEVKVLALEDQSFFLPYWMDAFRVDAEALSAIDGVGLHWYGDWFIPDTYYELFADLIHRKYPNQMMIYTEGSINGGFGPDAVLLGSWSRAEGYMYRLYMLLNNWNVGFIDWNLVLDPEGGPTTSFAIECPVIANTTADEFYKQPIFYGIGHYSKFIQPGAVKVRVDSNQKIADSPNVGSNNMKDWLRSYLQSKVQGNPPFPTIVIPQTIVSLAVANPDDSFTVIVLNTKNVTVPVRVVDSRVGSIVMDIENNSINTFVYWP